MLVIAYLGLLISNHASVANISVDGDFPLVANVEPAPGMYEVTAVFQRPVQRRDCQRMCRTKSGQAHCCETVTKCYDDFLFVCSWSGGTRAGQSSGPFAFDPMPNFQWHGSACQGSCDRWGGWKAAKDPRDDRSSIVYTHSLLENGFSVPRWDGYCDHYPEDKTTRDPDGEYMSHAAFSATGIAKEPLYPAKDPYGSDTSKTYWQTRHDAWNAGLMPALYLGARMDLRIPNQVHPELCPDRKYNPLCARADLAILEELETRKELFGMELFGFVMFRLFCCYKYCWKHRCQGQLTIGSQTETIDRPLCLVCCPFFFALGGNGGASAGSGNGTQPLSC